MRITYNLRYGKRAELKVTLGEGTPSAELQVLLDAVVDATKAIGGTVERTVQSEKSELL